MIANRIIKFKRREFGYGDEAEPPDDLMYGAANGMFFLYDPRNPTEFHCLTCRDEFAWEWEGCDEPDYECEPENDLGVDGSYRWIGFTTGGTIDIAAVESIWRGLERKMDVGAGWRWPGTVFYRSDVPGAIVLRLSRFWVQSSTHRSVFTLLLRMIVCYRVSGQTIRTLDEMIQSYHHAQACEPALKRFLAGYTKPTYSRWNDEYRDWQDKWHSGEINDDAEEPADLSDNERHLGFVAEFGSRPLSEIRRKLVKP